MVQDTQLIVGMRVGTLAKRQTWHMIIGNNSALDKYPPLDVVSALPADKPINPDPFATRLTRLAARLAARLATSLLVLRSDSHGLLHGGFHGSFHSGLHCDLPSDLHGDHLAELMKTRVRCV